MKRDFIILSVGKIFQIILSMLVIKIMTYYLSESEVGSYYLILSLISYCALVYINPMGMYVNRNFFNWVKEKRVTEIFGYYNVYIITIAIVSTIIMFALSNIFPFSKTVRVDLLLLVIFFSITINTWHQTILPSINMLLHRNSFTFFSILTTILGLVLSVGLIKGFHSSALYWIFGQLIAQFIVIVISLSYFKKILNETDSPKFSVNKIVNFNKRTIWNFIWPIAAATLFMWFQNQSYRLVTEQTIGVEVLAMIAVGFGVSSSISSAIESLVQQVYGPLFYKEISSNDLKQRTLVWNRVASISISIYITVAFFIFIMSPFLMRILVDKKFFDAYYYLYFGAWIEFFRMITNVYSSAAHSEYNTKSLILPYAAGGITAFMGVLIAAQFKYYMVTIPSVLLLSGLVTAIIMRIKMKKLLVSSMNTKLIRLSFFMSIPFLLVLFFYPFSYSFLASVIVMFFFGLYLISIQIVLFKKSNG